MAFIHYVIDGFSKRKKRSMLSLNTTSLTLMFTLPHFTVSLMDVRSEECHFNVWSSYLFHFSFFELLESELDLVRFHLRLNFLLNRKKYKCISCCRNESQNLEMSQYYGTFCSCSVEGKSTYRYFFKEFLVRHLKAFRSFHTLFSSIKYHTRYFWSANDFKKWLLENGEIRL